MRIILALLMCIFLLLPPAGQGDEKRPYVAVFTNPCMTQLIPWKNERWNLLYVGQNWDDFHNFLVEVKRHAGNQKIVIDIDCHGSDKDGLLWIQYFTLFQCHESFASMGYIVNQIERDLPPGQVMEVDCEACFSGIVYYRSLHRNKKVFHNFGDVIENATLSPPYPIYGVKNCPNMGNAVYLQRWKWHDEVSVYDLRDFETGGTGRAREYCWDYW